jgi:hypothetical protein
VTTRVVLQNNAAKDGTGYMNLTSVDAESQLVFRLGWRAC